MDILLTYHCIVGAPSEEFLSQEITSSDHAFLRAAVPSVQAHRKQNQGRHNITLRIVYNIQYIACARASGRRHHVLSSYIVTYSSSYNSCTRDRL